MNKSNSRSKSSSKSSSRAKNSASVTNSKGAMDRFKMEVANELGVDLKDGYNGNISAKEAGRVGGEMVKKMIKKQKSEMK